MMLQTNQAVSVAKPFVYSSRDPTGSRIYQVIQRNWRAFETQARDEGKKISGYAKREFERYLECGILSKGFVRLVCDSCKENRFIAFSCKKRGFCPSCCGRRMNDGAAFWVDDVLSHVPFRQWVVSFPIPIRFWMAKNPKLMSEALKVFQRTLAQYYQNAARNQGAQGRVKTGSVTVIQRFGGALNLNIHFHILALDGIYQENQGTELKFFQTLKPTNQDIQQVIKDFQIKMLTVLERRGLISNDPWDQRVDEDVQPEGIEELSQGASVIGRIGTGDNQGQRVRKIRVFGSPFEQSFSKSDLTAILGGFSLHAATYIHQNDRKALERMCRYLLRPPVSEDRCEIRGDNIRYHLKTPWSDGTRAIEFTGLEFIEKLIALIPQPRIHQTRFHGVLAPNAKMRSLVVPKPKQQSKSCDPKDDSPISKNRRFSWAQLLKRVFKVDLENCPCGGKLRFMAAIMDRSSIQRILDHQQIQYRIPDFDPP